MGNYLRDFDDYIKTPVAVSAGQHTVGTVEHTGVDTNHADGVRLLYDFADKGAAGTFALKVQDSDTGVVDSIAAATFTGSGLDDGTYGGTFTGTANATFDVVLDSVRGTGGVGCDDDWNQTTGTGLDDATIEGSDFTGTTEDTYVVTIASEGTPDTFDWTVNGGGGASGVAITGAAQTLSQGIEIKFAATTGHTAGDAWTLVCSPDTFKWRKDSGAYTADVEITGSAQTLSDGVTITFAATKGHTVNDKWSTSCIADTYSDVSGKTTGTLNAAANGAIDCYKGTKRYVRGVTTVANNTVSAGATWVLYDNKLSPNPL